MKIRLVLIDDRKNPELLTNLPTNSKVINTFGIGYAQALNAARGHIHSPYTAIMNSDDLVHPDRFARQIQKLVDQDFQVCACGIQKFKAGKNVVSRFGSLEFSGALDRRVLLLGAYGVDATWCGKSDWWVNNLEFIDRHMSDWATGIEVSRKIGIYFHSEKLYFYRQHPNQTTANQAFSSLGLNGIMKNWLLLATESNVQKLDLQEIAWVAAPRGRKPLDKIAIKKITNWLTQFNLATEGTYADLIARRYLLLLSNNPMNRYELKDVYLAATGANSLAKEILNNLYNLRKSGKYG